jgi:protein SCO1/2
MAAALSRRRSILIAFVIFDLLLAAVFLGLLLLRSERAQQAEDAALGIARFDEPQALREFTLTDQTGRGFTRDDLLGSWQFVFFGFTSCADVCPFAMQALETFYRNLGPELAAETGVVMVTVDPLRDTPAVMENYLASYHPDFIGLTGEYPQIASLAEQLYVAFGSHEDHSEAHHDDGRVQDYQVPHSDTIAVIDPAGRYRGMIHAPHNARRLSDAYAAFSAL